MKIIDGKIIYFETDGGLISRGYYLIDIKSLKNYEEIKNSQEVNSSKVAVEAILAGKHLHYYGTSINYGCGIDQRFLVKEHQNASSSDNIIYISSTRKFFDNDKTRRILVKFCKKTRKFGKTLDFSSLKEAYLNNSHERELCWTDIYYTSRSLGFNPNYKARYCKSIKEYTAVGFIHEKDKMFFDIVKTKWARNNKVDYTTYFNF